MCDACVINAVKDRMLSRRGLFKTAAAGAAATAFAATAVTPPALAAGHGAVEDMTHTLSPEFPTFGGTPGISMDKTIDFDTDGYNLLMLTVNEHTGTHLDAPLHFSKDGTSVDELSVSSLVVPLCVIDIREKAAADADAQVTPEDLQAWIGANGDIPENACVAMNSGWAAHVGTDKFRGADENGGLHFPGFHVEATNMLMEQTSAAAIAVDTLSLDHGPSPDFAVHYSWLPAGRYGIENMANLDAVPAAGATLVVGAPKHKGGTGGPARIFAMV